MTAQIDFLVRLRKLDRLRITPRDVIILWVIREIPGCMGRELSTKVGAPSRSSIQGAIPRLIKRGLLEDRRIKLTNLTPNDLYITDAGRAFLNEMVPVDATPVP